jgi:hypothetical protein
MKTFTYYFDALSILPRYHILASGEADISYSISPAEPDVGIMSPYVADIDVTSVVIYGRAQGQPNLNLDTAHPLYSYIVDALMDSDDLIEACEEDDREPCDY